MATIQDFLSKILNSRYGKDVRQAIHDAIHQCYSDGKAGAIDLEARESIDAINSNFETSALKYSYFDQIVNVTTDGTWYVPDYSTFSEKTILVSFIVNVVCSNSAAGLTQMVPKRKTATGHELEIYLKVDTNQSVNVRVGVLYLG